MRTYSPPAWMQTRTHVHRCGPGSKSQDIHAPPTIDQPLSISVRQVSPTSSFCLNWRDGLRHKSERDTKVNPRCLAASSYVRRDGPPYGLRFDSELWQVVWEDATCAGPLQVSSKSVTV